MKSNLSQLRQNCVVVVFSSFSKPSKNWHIVKHQQQWTVSSLKIQLLHMTRVSHALLLIQLYRIINYKLWLYFCLLCCVWALSIWPVKIELALDSRIYVSDFKQCQFNYSSGLAFVPTIHPLATLHSRQLVISRTNHLLLIPFFVCSFFCFNLLFRVAQIVELHIPYPRCSVLFCLFLVRRIFYLLDGKCATFFSKWKKKSLSHPMKNKYFRL